MSETIHYEMGYMPAEFARVLEGNFSSGDSPYRAERLAENHWQLISSGRDLQIDLNIQPQAARSLGMFSLPVLKVSFEVEAASTDARSQFFDKFFKYFHKGGG